MRWGKAKDGGHFRWGSHLSEPGCLPLLFLLHYEMMWFRKVRGEWVRPGDSCMGLSSVRISGAHSSPGSTSS